MLEPGPIWDGAVKGALVPLVVVLLAPDCYNCEGFYATTVAIGAGIGLGIDAAFGPKTLYVAAARPRKVGLAPILGRDWRGISASIRF